MDEPRDPNQPDQKPVKRSGRKKPRSKRSPTYPAQLASVTQLFDGDASKATTSKVEVPPGGVPGSPDKRRRKRVEPRVELGKRWSTIYRAVEDGEYTWDEFCESLTPSELARGQLMDANGQFRGRPPKFVPRQFLNACTRELLRRGGILWKENYTTAIEVMTAIATDPTAKPAERLRAAEFIIERLEGKVPQVVTVTTEDPWQTIIDGVVAEVAEDQSIARAHGAAYAARQAMQLDDGDGEG